MTISIAMATYNGEAYLREQLDSIAAQTLLPFEVQIGDDGSTDRTEEIVRDFAASAPFSVAFHRNQENLGFGENFLQTARRCSGTHIAFCDQDDIWSSSKLERVQSEFDRSASTYVLVVSNAEFGDENANRMGRPLHHFAPGVYRDTAFELTWLVEGFVQAFSANLVRDFPIEGRLPTAPAPRTSAPLVVAHAHDSWIAYLANVVGEIRILADQLAVYRRHGRSLTSRRQFSMGDQIVTGFTNHAERYRDLGDWYALAATVSTRMSEIGEGEVSKAFARATEKAKSEADFLHSRSDFWIGTRFSDRMRPYLRMLHGGAYWRSENFSRLAFFKDTFGLLAGSRFRQ